jgi:hypothetical protein
MDNRARCQICGYPLAGLATSVCPECGAQFDAADSRTYQTSAGAPGTPPRVEVPAWWFLLLMFGCTVVSLGVLSNPRVSQASLGLFAIAVGTAAACLVAYAVLVVLRSRYKGKRRPHWLGGTRWAAPLIMALVMSCTGLFYRWPMYLRFRISRTEFDCMARASLAGQVPSAGPRWVGLYWIESVDAPQSGVVRFHLGRGILEQVGFVHRASGVADGWHLSLGGPWYVEHWY